ncbi:MAG: polymer-forming cytoskeletal protein [Burkholderiaceae bacterium]|jgi:cytoskeletal protein CcmA (bactofilin family)|nr:polymer-forming cytoskeletal protein [Burkholderiaceae bacterium]MBU6291115.1 polymer-forming cytoskeletal protein [Burkholderiales bacterium]NCW85285.1 polymer-forming cytoskeletal protein [Oxalobacteraceae bacterium]
MNENNAKGDLFIGSGVVAKGSLTAPGLIVVDGAVDGVISASAVDITGNGVVTGATTANNIRVAGQLMDTSTAHQSLLIESTGQVTGDISYGDLEIRKGGNIAGSINARPAKS